MKVFSASLILLFLTSMSVYADDSYVSWTFDDFNSNGEVVELVEDSSDLQLEFEPGELGW